MSRALFFPLFILKLLCAVCLFSYVSTYVLTHNSQNSDDAILSIRREHFQSINSSAERWTGIESRAKRSAFLKPKWIYWVWDIYVAKDCQDLIARVNSASFPKSFLYLCPWMSQMYCTDIRTALNQTTPEWCKYREAARVIYPLCCDRSTTPVDGFWSAWKDSATFLDCSVTCGDGTITYDQTRSCDNPPPSSGGEYCRGPSYRIQTKSCHPSDCPVLPVDGGWSDWGQWEIIVDCSVTCGSGERTYQLTRKCNNPRPSNGGRDCVGTAKIAAYQQCLKPRCPPIVHGGWSGWITSIPLPPCPVTCGVSYIRVTQTRQCTNPPPSNGGLYCQGPSRRNVSARCILQDCRNQPVHGGWSAWQDPVPLPACPVSCGTGLLRYTRTRQCNNPPPSYGGRGCSGYLTQTAYQICTQPDCPGPVHGGWSAWQDPVPLPACQVTCGTGTITYTRTRQCNNPPPSNGGNNCLGSSLQAASQFCNTQSCPVHGGWSAWQDPVPLPACPVTCGTGTITYTRTRQCNNPPPSNGGNNCLGSSLQAASQFCTQPDCPGKLVPDLQLKLHHSSVHSQISQVS
ncbi:hemicentin-1-like [Gigantopelta aegis]|uniref:hemicentin-1-like n=1 Tax=Gigantopelta aegis TaxID=1735272 RepID=UPI001B887A44|nr:hemicentin-1-like [Gigantopelta aegis]